MIHYNQIEKRLAKRKQGEEVILIVSGMIAIGRYRAGHEKEGEPIPPAIENGTHVKVLTVDADSIQVATEQGKKLTFGGAVGARKLEETNLKAFPKNEPASGPI